MELKTSKSVWGFFAITLGCAALGATAQFSQNLESGRAEASRSKALTTIAQHQLADTCRSLNGGMFQRGEVVKEEGGEEPTACYTNEVGEYAFVARLNGKLQIRYVMSAKEVESRKSEMRQQNHERQRKD